MMGARARQTSASSRRRIASRRAISGRSLSTSLSAQPNRLDAAQNAGVRETISLITVSEIPVSVKMNDAEAVVFFRAGADSSIGDCVLSPKHHRKRTALKRHAAGVRDTFLDEVYGTGAVYRFLCVKPQCSGGADAVPGFKLLGRLEQGSGAA